MVSILLWVLLSLSVYLLIEKVLLPRTLRWSAFMQLQVSPVAMPLTAQALAQKLLDRLGYRGLVALRSAEFDQYNNDNKHDRFIGLSSETANSDKIPDGFIAAHEVGHSVVDLSSRLASLVIDLSAYAQTPVVSKVLFVASGVCALMQWQTGLVAALLALLVQTAAASVILLVESSATRYGTLMINETFELPRNVGEALRRCGRAALSVHARDLARPAALLVVLSQLTAYNRSALLVIPLVALAVYCYLFVSCWVNTRRGFSKFRD